MKGDYIADFGAESVDSSSQEGNQPAGIEEKVERVVDSACTTASPRRAVRSMRRSLRPLPIQATRAGPSPPPFDAGKRAAVERQRAVVVENQVADAQCSKPWNVDGERAGPHKRITPIVSARSVPAGRHAP